MKAKALEKLVKREGDTWKCYRCGCEIDGEHIAKQKILSGVPVRCLFHKDKLDCIHALKAKLSENMVREMKPERFANLRKLTTADSFVATGQFQGELVDVTQEQKDLLAAYDEAIFAMNVSPDGLTLRHNWLKKWS